MEWDDESEQDCAECTRSCYSTQPGIERASFVRDLRWGIPPWRQWHSEMDFLVSSFTRLLSFACKIAKLDTGKREVVQTEHLRGDIRLYAIAETRD